MYNRNFGRIFFSLLILFAFVSIRSQNNSNPEITAEEIKEHLTFLASDKMEGRYSGTEELFAAAVYISDEFKNYGLEPLFQESFTQEFPFVKTIELTDKNSLTFLVNENEIKPKLKEDYITVPFSGNVEVTSKSVFAGFGISAPDLKYDDYDGIDVQTGVMIRKLTSFIGGSSSARSPRSLPLPSPVSP